jgi:thymidylate kinase
MLIIEGPDFTGKSRLAQELARVQHSFYWHSTATKALRPGLADYHMNIARNMVSNSPGNKQLVLDRFWPSEICYGPVFGRDLTEYISKLRPIVEFAESLFPVYVFCSARDTVKRFAEHNDEHVDPMHDMDEIDYMNISANYYGLAGAMMDAGYTVVWYDYELHGTYPAFNQWYEELSRKQLLAQHYRKTPDYARLESYLNERE